MQELSEEHVTTPRWRNELHGAGLMNCIDVSLARRPAMRRFDVQTSIWHSPATCGCLGYLAQTMFPIDFFLF
jgi:hypothetical protein